RPGSSIVSGTLLGCTVTTETCAGGGAVVVAGLAGPQAARTRLIDAAARPARKGVVRSVGTGFPFAVMADDSMLALARRQPISFQTSRRRRHELGTHGIGDVRRQQGVDLAQVVRTELPPHRGVDALKLAGPPRAPQGNGRPPVED